MKNTSQVIKKEQCPRCASKGNDNSGDNLVVYADGGKHCFACGYSVLSSTYKREHGLEEIVIKHERTIYNRAMAKYQKPIYV